MGRSSDAPRFVVVGRFIADCIAKSPHLPTWGRTLSAHSVRMAPGGKALNQAVALARQGAYVTAVGTIGDDSLGRGILETLQAEGVDTKGMEVRQEAATPVCICIIGDDGETAFLWSAGEDVVATPETVRRAAEAIEHADTTLVTFEVPTATISRAITLSHDAGRRVVVHPGPTNSDIDHLALPWDQVDVLVPNEVEARALLAGGDAAGTGAPNVDLARHLARRTGVPAVVVPLGEDGCAVDGPGLSTHVPAIADIPVTDTMGASDAFTADLALRLTRGAPLGADSRRFGWTYRSSSGSSPVSRTWLARRHRAGVAQWGWSGSPA